MYQGLEDSILICLLVSMSFIANTKNAARIVSTNTVSTLFPYPCWSFFI